MRAVPPVVPSVVPPVVPSVMPQVVPSVGYYTLGVRRSALEMPKAHDLRRPRSCGPAAAVARRAMPLHCDARASDPVGKVHNDHSGRRA